MKKIPVLILLFFAPNLFGAESPPMMRDPSVLSRVTEAKEFIAGETPEPIFKGTGKKKILIGKESLRATLSPAGVLRLVRLSLVQTQKTATIKTKKGSRKKTVTTLGLVSVAPISCQAEKLGGGGVNANYRIICDGQEEIVLAGRELLTDGRPPWKTSIYVPYSDALATHDAVSAGEAYLHEQISKAAESLRKKKVFSKAIPGRLVADVIPEEMLFLVALIEHIDHDEFKERGPHYMMRKVLTQLGANGPDAFLYARSRTGALCLMQIQPTTYREIQRSYRTAKLPISAVAGSCTGHEQAIEVAYLVLDSKLSDMPASFQKKFMDDPGSFGIYLAAAYNGGQGRAAGLYMAEDKRGLGLLGVLENIFERLGIKKERKSLSKILREETWVFIKKYFELSNIPDANGN